MMAPENSESFFEQLLPDKWYVHVYQTKIKIEQNNWKTLSSRKMAKYMNNTWRGIHWPRNVDLKEKVVRVRSKGTSKKVYANSSVFTNNAKSKRLNFKEKRTWPRNTNNRNQKWSWIDETEKDNRWGRTHRDSCNSRRWDGVPKWNNGGWPKKVDEHHRVRWYPREWGNNRWNKMRNNGNRTEWANPTHYRSENLWKQMDDVSRRSTSEFKGVIAEALQNMSRSIKMIQNKCQEM